MKRLGWLTDIHLNFLQAPECVAFLDAVADKGLDAVLIGGDIGEGDTIEVYLRMVARHLPCPVYFVLGNHDFYNSGFAAIRRLVHAVCRDVSNLHWLTAGQVVTLPCETALIGHDGWADGRDGDFFASNVEISDYFFIRDLMHLDARTRFQKLNALGDEAAAYFKDLLARALQSHTHILLLTHVPPFKEASWYEGKVSNDDYLPHFSCRAVGEVLLEIMRQHPDKHLTVLCGHTHGSGVVQVAPNVLVKTGGAAYGAPRLQEVIVA